MRVVRAAVFVAMAALVPWWWCARGADALYDDDLAAQRALADGLVTSLARGVSVRTGSDRFDGEWTLVTWQMAALGLGQVVAAHPSLRARYLPTINRCVEAMLEPRARAFGTAAWHEDGLVDFTSAHGHAYLGYLDLALGMLRRIDPHTRYASLHDQLTASLASRLARSPAGLIETYPGEAYPPDVASVVGAIGLHARATGADHGELLRAWSAVYRARYVDPVTGFLTQSADVDTGARRDGPRGSGTAIAAYFLSFADPALAGSLRGALATRGRASLLGFGGVREYPDGRAGRGDIDSGPVVLGVSVSATAFGLSSARQRGDRAWFTSLARTASLFGAHRDDGWITGTTFGNAILLAMTTAERR